MKLMTSKYCKGNNLEIKVKFLRNDNANCRESIYNFEINSLDVETHCIRAEKCEGKIIDFSKQNTRKASIQGKEIKEKAEICEK